MIDKLQQVEERFEKVNDLLCLPETVSDQNKYASLMKELKTLTPLVETYREYKKAVGDGEAAKEMLGEKPDKEMRELLEAEVAECRSKAEKLSEKLKILLLPKDPNDNKNVIIEINKEEHSIQVSRSFATERRSISERGDYSYIFSAVIEIESQHLVKYKVEQYKETIM